MKICEDTRVPSTSMCPFYSTLVTPLFLTCYGAVMGTTNDLLIPSFVLPARSPARTPSLILARSCRSLILRPLLSLPLMQEVSFYPHIFVSDIMLNFSISLLPPSLPSVLLGWRAGGLQSETKSPAFLTLYQHQEHHPHPQLSSFFSCQCSSSCCGNVSVRWIHK